MNYHYQKKYKSCFDEYNGYFNTLKDINILFELKTIILIYLIKKINNNGCDKCQKSYITVYTQSYNIRYIQNNLCGLTYAI